MFGHQFFLPIAVALAVALLVPRIIGGEDVQQPPNVSNQRVNDNKPSINFDKMEIDELINHLASSNGGLPKEEALKKIEGINDENEKKKILFNLLPQRGGKSQRRNKSKKITKKNKSKKLTKRNKSKKRSRKR